jgi:peptidoglycan/xylan/chitin deacetylase (PgdA/CDA1 family)
MKKRTRLKKNRFLGFLVIMATFIIILINITNRPSYMVDLQKMSINSIKEYAKKNSLKLNIKYEYDNNIAKNKLVKQNIEKQTKLTKNMALKVIISLGKTPISLYKENKVNELGLVPIMMYHGIHDIKDNIYTGGNVDKDGYNRTVTAFKKDLDRYYNEGYRMIKLNDYIDGNIDVKFGKSPIILTFDDGASNNIKVLGKNKDNSLEIDPNSAVGILESYKKKYPDFNITATFFINDELFNQPKYNNDILKWLIDHNYDIGNHTKDHIKIADVTKEKTMEQIAKIYQQLDTIIPNKYVKIIALPFGSPNKKDHDNFKYVLNGEYNGYKYKNDATLRVGWDANTSPFDINFDKTYLKRIRAWDNNGVDFDIDMVFNNLKKTKYISDGKIKTVVIPKTISDKYNKNNSKTVVTY